MLKKAGLIETPAHWLWRCFQCSLVPMPYSIHLPIPIHQKTRAQGRHHPQRSLLPMSAPLVALQANELLRCRCQLQPLRCLDDFWHLGAERVAQLSKRKQYMQHHAKVVVKQVQGWRARWRDAGSSFLDASSYDVSLQYGI